MTGQILLVGNPKAQETLAALCRDLGYQQFQFAASSGEAKRKLGEMEFDLMIINTPLADDFGRDLALSAQDAYMVSVIMLVGNGMADQVAAGLEKYGVFVLSKPLSRALAAQTLKFIRVAQYRMKALEKRNRQLLRKLESMQQIGRAKCALIQYRGMTENEAHHYIEQLAMDRRTSAKEVALNILETFGDGRMDGDRP